MILQLRDIVGVAEDDGAVVVGGEEVAVTGVVAGVGVVLGVVVGDVTGKW